MHLGRNRHLLISYFAVDLDVDVVWGCMSMGGLLGVCAKESMQAHEYRYGCGIEGCISVVGRFMGVMRVQA